MKSNGNSDSLTNANSSGASVPISVYRELAIELQATRAMVDSLNSKNQILTQQNQQLRYEIERVVQFTANLRPLVEPSGNGQRSPNPSRPTHEPPSPDATAEASAIAARLRSNDGLLSDDLVMQEGIYIQPKANVRSKELGGWGMTLIVLVVIVTAFGVGFLAVSPLLQPKR